jgi:hypothetical protein
MEDTGMGLDYGTRVTCAAYECNIRERIAASTNLHPCASHRHRCRMAAMIQRCSHTIVLMRGGFHRPPEPETSPHKERT